MHQACVCVCVSRVCLCIVCVCYWLRLVKKHTRILDFVSSIVLKTLFLLLLLVCVFWSESTTALHKHTFFCWSCAETFLLQFTLANPCPPLRSICMQSRRLWKICFCVQSEHTLRVYNSHLYISLYFDLHVCIAASDHNYIISMHFIKLYKVKRECPSVFWLLL